MDKIRGSARAGDGRMEQRACVKSFLPVDDRAQVAGKGLEDKDLIDQPNGHAPVSGCALKTLP